jgi:hypothetical protein
VRVYVPVDAGGLRRLVAEGALPGPLQGCAVTPALREWYREGDAEDLEYAASARAGDLSLGLIASDPRPRRIVVAADAPAVPDPSVDDVAGVRLPDGLAWRDAAAVLADDGDDALLAVAAAVVALERASVDVPPEVEDLDAFELAWFDPAEFTGAAQPW